MGMAMNQSMDKLQFDRDGFLLDCTHWNDEVAQQIAISDGLGELDSCQLEIIHQLRESYDELGSLPSLAHVCHLRGMPGDCMSIYFPNPREAWRLAGLPNPGEEAKSYL